MRRGRGEVIVGVGFCWEGVVGGWGIFGIEGLIGEYLSGKWKKDSVLLQ